MTAGFKIRFLVGRCLVSQDGSTPGCSNIDLDFDAREVRVYLPAGLNKEQVAQMMTLVEGAELAGERLAGLDAARRYNLGRVISTESAPATA